MIDKATVKKILGTADIVEVVSDYVNLTRRGANYMGLCPFHNERTPSFSVSPARGICHCFSCGKGGSPVNFIMEKEGINFHDALLHLAKKYGIKVEEKELTDEERAEQSKRESMLVVNEWAMRQFETNLTQTEEGRNVGMTYLQERGLTQRAIDRFHLGYAIDKGTSLYDAALRQGFEESVLLETGLCGKSSRDGRPYDRMRGRVIFPIFSPAGKVIAFGARGIKGEAAKYVNSPESLIYRKSNELYGIYQAKNAIVRQKKCFLVEGYMDVISMWQSGFENTVASSGTSLTDGQIALIHRFCENVTLIYDGDAAGIKASLRGIDLLLSHKLNIKVLLLPDGDDPDSFCKNHTPQEVEDYIAAHEEDFIAFKTRILLSTQADTPQQRGEAIRSIVTSLASIPDMMQRSLYVQKTALMLNVQESILSQEVGKALIEVTENRQRRQRMQRQADALAAQQAAQQSPQQNSISAQQSPQAPQQGPAPQPNSTPQQSSIPAQQSPQAPQQGAAPQPYSTYSSANVDPRLLQTHRNPFEAVERTVAEYLIKYGMLPFCEAISADEDPNAPIQWLNVAQYVREDMAADSVKFSNPLYERVFQRVLALTEPFQEEQQHFYTTLQEAQEAEYKSFCDQLAAEGLSLAQLQKREEEWQQERAEKMRVQLEQFACDYIGHELGSDPDDDLRHLVLKTITPQYHLSKYHSKLTKIPSEAERLPNLLPRALYEWKDEILNQQFKKIQEELRAPGLTSEQMTDILKRLADISQMRSQLATMIGERILTPPH